ncbi:MAG: DUF4129 domain-containing protein [Candidatus Dormibacteraeota bacterium]|nr:DUF4129 domain-containing protein [Candidatus Dormibacteraeota bacterium]
MSRGTGAYRRGLVAVAVVVLALAAGALARSATGEVVVGAAAPSLRVAVDAASYLFLALIVVGAIGLVWLLWPQAEDAPLTPLERRRHPLLTSTAIGLVLILVAWRLGQRPGFLPVLRLRPADAGSGPGSVLAQRAGAGAGTGGVDWIALVLVALLLLTLALLAWRRLRPRSNPRAAAPIAEVVAALDEALEPIGELDPRLAVIAAWSRVERAMAAHGAPRQESEAPFEFARRATTLAGLPAPVLDDLARLYEWARFSIHPVTASMREESVRRLQAVREALSAAS